MTSPLSLSFQKLGCNRGGRPLFQGVDCTLQGGHWLYLAGANGVGKTSLLRMVCGLSPVEFGSICWNDVPIHKQRDVYRQSLCYLGHLNGLQEAMTVGENMAFTSALAGLAPNHAQTLAVLARFGLAGRSQQLVRHLSQGQKRRVALSRLALSPARLWVLDEPFVGMDDGGVTMLTDLIAEHLSGGGLAVLTSHQPVTIGSFPAQVLELRR